MASPAHGERLARLGPHEIGVAFLKLPSIEESDGIRMAALTSAPSSRPMPV